MGFTNSVGRLEPSFFHRLGELAGLESLHLSWVLPDLQASSGQDTHTNHLDSHNEWETVTLANLHDLYICDNFHSIAHTLFLLNLPVLDTLRIETEYHRDEPLSDLDSASLGIIWSTLNKHARFPSAMVSPFKLHFMCSVTHALGYWLPVGEGPDSNPTSSFGLSPQSWDAGFKPLLGEACRALWFDSIQEVYFGDYSMFYMQPKQFPHIVGNFGAVWRLVCCGYYFARQLWPLLGSSMPTGKIALPMLREFVVVTMGPKENTSYSEYNRDRWRKSNREGCWKKLGEALQWRKELGMGIDFLVVYDSDPNGCLDITAEEQLLLASEVKKFRFMKAPLVS